jgi:predicted transcriptional regulator
MLTEKQFKVLMILFDNKGHAGWELAKDLKVEESNLNPFLKRLEKKKFIFQGTPRKSNRPKKSEEIKKREGDYKEFPYYLTNDLQILDKIIREMAVTNRVFNTGFPFNIIKTSKYIKSMRLMFKEDLNKCLVYAAREAHIDRSAIVAEVIEHEIHRLIQDKKPANPLLKDKRIRSKKALKELELWYDSYLSEHL